MKCPICEGEMEHEEVLTNKTNLTVLFECSDCGYSNKYSREQTSSSLIISIREEMPTFENNVDIFLRQTKRLYETLSRDDIDFIDIEDEFRIMLFSDDEYIRDSKQHFRLGLVASLDGNKIE
jgi:uncharacterized Zn finger protein